MVYIPGLGSSSWPGGLAGVPGADGAEGSGGGSGVSTADGRLTTVSGTPILTSNQLAKTTLYYTPFKGDQIALYSGGAWSVLTFAETSLSLSGYTASKNYDIWGYNNGGTLALDSTVWTNDTTRATALTTQDGIYCKTGDTTRRYLGSARINSTGGQIDWVIGTGGSGGVEAKITIWNENNRVLISNTIRDTASSWTHANNSSWTSMNGSANNRQSLIIGRSIEPVSALLAIRTVSASGTAGTVAFALDSTSTPITNQLFTASVGYSSASPYTELGGKYEGLISEGSHYLQAVDYSTGGITTFQGSPAAYNQSGFIFKGYF